MLRGLIALVACVSAVTAAPLMTNHPLDALAEAHALIAGRVISLQKGAQVSPPEGRTWQHPVFEHVAEVEILRFHATGRGLRERLEASRSVQVRYKAENPLGQGGVFGGPLWPAIRVGDVRVFGVRDSAESFRLWFEEGLGVLPPAQETLLRDLPAADGVAFLERELVNGLASGEAKAAFEAARYADVAFFGSYDAVKDRRPPLQLRFSQMLADDLPRIRLAAAALLASQGSPRLSLADLRAKRAPDGRILTTFHWLLISALELLPEENADALIIQTLLENLPTLPWGALAGEYSHHPALDDPLDSAVARRQPGILPLLEALMREGRSDLTPSALTIAREQMAGQNLPPADWHPAGRLILNHGSDADFTAFLGLILRAQAHDPELYRTLWSAAAYDEQGSRARMLRLLAIFLYDDREAFSRLRYSEMAAHRLTFFSGDRFGLDPHRSLAASPAAERREAVLKSRTWLASRPAP